MRTSGCGLASIVLPAGGCALLLAAPASAQIFGDKLSIAIPPNRVTDVEAADLDGDGDLDVVWSGSLFIDRIGWSENLGGGTFGPERVITTSVNLPSSVHVMDVDGDGHMDVLSASTADNRVAWYANQNDGTFGVQQVISTATGDPNSLASADFDGDGVLDVLLSSHFDDTVGWLPNQGGGSFAPLRTISTSTTDRPFTVVPADLDGDGDPDVVVAESDDNQVSWYENLGGGVFGPEQVISALASQAFDVFAGDLDADGDVDVVSASTGDNKIAWYENLGGGAFGGQSVISTAVVTPTTVRAADLDGDGDLDVLSSSFTGSNLTWYENVGSGVFGPQRIIADDLDEVLSIDVANMDGDQDLDVVMGASGGQEVAWYENWGQGTVYCRPSVMNGSGRTGKITATGTTIASVNALTLVAYDVTPSNFAIFLTSPSQAPPVRPPNSIGNLCLGAPIGRYVAPGQIQPTGPAGIAELRLDLTRTPTPTGLVQIQPGETWNFQCWHRDSVLGMATSNFTDAIGVMFR